MKIALFAALMAGLASPATAGVVMYNINTNTGSDEVMYDILVSDDTPGVFDFQVSISDGSPMGGDVVALYFDFVNADANDGYGASDFSGDAITGVDFDTRNVQNGNIGRRFQFGLAIGTPGAGRDFYDAFSFTMDIRNGLGLDDLSLFGVRGTSVGVGADANNPGNGSAKTFVEQGQVPPAQQIPLPTSAGLAMTGAAFVCGSRRRRVL